MRNSKIGVVLTLVENAWELEARNRELSLLNEAMRDSIKWALNHCPVCSPKPGSPTLCKQCLVIRASLGGSRHEYFYEE